MKNDGPQQWCKKNNWTELRKLENGIWVAFPPGGLIETPLPDQPEKYEVQFKTNRFQDIVNGAILIVAAVGLGAIALIMSPYFLLSMMSRYKKQKSMT